MHAIDIIDALGGDGPLSTRLQLGRSTVTMWRSRGIPAERALQLYQLIQTDRIAGVSLEAILRTAPQPQPVAFTDQRRFRRGKAPAIG
jgi:hypothetical protein